METEGKKTFDWNLNSYHAKSALLMGVKRLFSAFFKSSKLYDPHLVLQTKKTQNECKQNLCTGYGAEKEGKRTMQEDRDRKKIGQKKTNSSRENVSLTFEIPNENNSLWWKLVWCGMAPLASARVYVCTVNVSE